MDSFCHTEPWGTVTVVSTMTSNMISSIVMPESEECVIISVIQIAAAIHQHKTKCGKIKSTITHGF